MKKFALFCLSIILILSTTLLPLRTFAEDLCKSIKPGDKILWDGSELRPGQIGKVSILQETPLVNLAGNQEKILKKGGSYRIYSFKGDLLGLGGGFYVKRDSKISYSTPSKDKLQAVVCASKPLTGKPANEEKTGSNTATDNSCEGIKLGQKIFWDGSELRPGQIGRVIILQDTPLITLDGKQSKILKKGETYRIYNFKANLLGVGSGYYVARDQKITFKTPSKQKLAAVVCASNQPVLENSNEVSKPTLSISGKKPVNIGPQVFNTSTIAAKAGMDSKGNAYLYVILHGTPTSLAVVDINTNEIQGVYPLQDSTSASALAVGEDGLLWVAGTNSGNLYSFNPNTKTLKNHGRVLVNANDTSIQDIVVNDKYVYGVTAYGANVFKYNKKTNKREFILPTLKNKQYAKSVALDEKNQYLYISVGSTAELLQWNLGNNSKTTILPAQYKNETYVAKMILIDQYLFTKFYPSEKAGIYDLNSKKYIKEFKMASRGFSAKNEQTNELYYSYEGIILAYNLKTGVFRNTNARLPENTEALSLDLVRLKDNPSQNVLVGLVDNNGTYFIYNPTKNEIAIKKFEAPPQPVNLHLLFSSPDQKKIYINGYMSGGLTQYDPVEKTSIQLNGISQLESAHFANGKMYIAAYPKARLMEIDSDQPWDQRVPQLLVKLDHLGQERIPALISHKNHLYAGTYPQYSNKGGLLLDYDLNTKQYRVYEDYIQNQSIITLLPHGGYIYGGTSIHANYQKAPDGAKFFRFNPAHPNNKELITLPLKASMVMSLIQGPDGLIWGAADGLIFSYNPVTKNFKTKKLFSAISGRYGNAKLLIGKDGFIYGTLEDHFFKMNPKTMEYGFILKGGAKELTQDNNGNLYYRYLSNLYMYPLK
ncbi:WD40 repeat domain-containing protein [Neobacillus drentensis]|uniref:WD40 repeat domain-containing protein n=1 Tax=Neobacillus drentensis TaxID=220684 RepID=UPI0030029376